MGNEFDNPNWSVDTLPATKGVGGNGLNYPSIWPDGAYLLRGDQGHTIEVDKLGIVTVHIDNDVEELNELLEREGLTALADRTPVLAIGSNRAPRSLRDRLTTIPDPTPDDLVVPVFDTQVQGLDVVYGARPTTNGSYPAMLYGDEVTAGTILEVGIAFFNDRQLARVDATEGVVYKRIVLPGCEVHIGDKVVPVQFYSANQAVFWAEDGPRAVSAVKAEGRTIRTMSQLEFSELVMGHLMSNGGMDQLNGIYFDLDNPEHQQILASYRATPPYAHEIVATIAEGKHLTAEKAPRSAATRAIAARLGELGLTKVVGIPEGFVAHTVRRLTNNPKNGKV
jgi:hypothetical protein